MAKKYIKSMDQFINENYSLNEGLIRSYDADMIISQLQKMGIDSDDVYINNGTIKMELKLQYRHIIKATIDKMENLFGWFLSGVQGDLDDGLDGGVEEFKKDMEYSLEQIAEEDYLDEDDSIATLIFEPKFGTDISSDNLPNIAYHVTDRQYLDKIRKIGLVPKHKDKITYHPDRIYLFIDEKNVSGLLDNIHFDIDNPVLLKIDISEFKKHNKFYVDPNLSDGGVYVLGNIPPRLIISETDL
jgi:hypothetical protein